MAISLSPSVRARSPFAQSFGVFFPCFSSMFSLAVPFAVYLIVAPYKNV
jgi:hypothetical protein